MEPIDYERIALSLAIKDGNVELVSNLTKLFNDHSLKSWRPGYGLLCDALQNRYLHIAKILINHGCRIVDGEERGSALHYAMIYGDYEIIKTLIEKGSSLTLKDCKKMTPFHLLAQRYPVDEDTSLILNYLLSKDSIDINYKDSSTRFSLLHFAAKHGNLEMITLLLSNNSFIEQQGNRDQTPLHVASLYAQTKAVRLLLEFGAQYDAQDYFEKTPLCLAVEKEDIKTIQVFLNHFLQLEPEVQQLSPIIYDSMLVYCAILTNNKSILEILLQRGANPNNYSEKFGETPLHLAVERGFEAIVCLLLEYGANLNKPKQIRDRGSTELHVAVEKGHEEIFRNLLKHGADPRKLNAYKLNPLHIATRKGSFAIIKAILKSGYDISSMFTAELLEGRTPLHYAVKNCNQEIVSLFLEHDIPINAFDNFGLSPLHIACQKGDKQIVELLLTHGAEINSRYFHFSLNETIECPLYFVAEVGCHEIVTLFCEISDNWKTNSQEAYAALYVAAYNGHKDVVEVLLEKGVDPNDHSEKYLSPLHAASQKGHLHIVNSLLLHGADINPKLNEEARKFSTPLIAAILSGNEAIVEIFLTLGADVNIKLFIENLKSIVPDECLLKYGCTYDSYQFSYKDLRNGFTPIHCAAVNGKKAIIELLLKNGADVNSKTGNNTTPLAIAVEKGHVGLVALLLEAGARIDLEVYGQYPFFVAIRNKNLEIVKLIFNYIDQDKFVSNLIIEDGFIPLLSAIMVEATDIVEFFLKKDINPNFYMHNHASICSKCEFDIRNEFPLHVAVEICSTDIVKLLINFGASVNTRCINGLGPLFHALKAGRIENFKLLLQHGACFEQRNRNNETLLHFALEEQLNSKLVKFLLECGADVTEKCHDLLPIACLYDNTIDEEEQEEVKEDEEDPKNDNNEDEIFNLLLKFDSPKNVQVPNMIESLLCFDSELGIVSATKSLLQYGADINILSRTGKSPLYQICCEAFKMMLNNEDERAYFNLEDESVRVKVDLECDNWKRFCPYEIYQRLFNYSKYDELIKDAEQYREVAKLWTRTIAKMERAGKYVREEHFDIVESLFVKRYYLHCKNEIEEMKQTVISGSVTFFDILTVSEMKLTNFVRNGNIINVMKSYDYHNVFPVYAEDLKFRYKRGIEKRILIDMSVNFLNTVLRIKLPILIVYEIFRYLNSSDLRNLCRIYDRSIFVTSDNEEVRNNEFLIKTDSSTVPKCPTRTGRTKA